MALRSGTVCAGGLCSADTCCFESPCTTGTTTLPTTVTTTPATTVTTTPATTVTTTLPTTVTTTPQLNCADFKCPAKFTLRSPLPTCDNGLCSADVCCFESPCTTGTTTIPTTVTTTPATTVTTTPKPYKGPCTTMEPAPTPSPPPNPCAPQSPSPSPSMPQVTIVPRLYNDKEAEVAFAQPEPKKENA